VDNAAVDLRRLELLLELSRLGSMRAVADVMHVSTSTVSQQLAVLSREAGAPLVEPDGRRVRLTPAGRRLADHAVAILAAVEAARVDLDPSATPAGVLRVASFATGIRDALLPVVRVLSAEHPDVRVQIHEHEPPEAFELLAGDAVDLALTYDYNLAPATFDRALVAHPLWHRAWGLAVPSGRRASGTAADVFARFANDDWIVASRNVADGDVVRTLASMAGFAPRITHEADSLELVQDLVLAGLGVGLLPASGMARRGISVLRLHEPEVTLRSYAVARRGRTDWPPLALVLRLLAHSGWSRAQPRAPSPPRISRGSSRTNGGVRPGRTPEQPEQPMS
jgi:DNA-binding transcriptional LysR family regulator